MHINILEQLRFRVPNEGFGNLKPGAIVTFETIKETIKTHFADVFSAFIDNESPRLAIQAPHAIYTNGKTLELVSEILKDGQIRYRDEVWETTFDTVLNGTLGSKVELIYRDELKSSIKQTILEVGSRIHIGEKSLYFIDNKTGDIGYFPANMSLTLDKSDEDRFLVFESEEDRDSFFTKVFGLQEDILLENAGEICNCLTCEGLRQAASPIIGGKMTTTGHEPFRGTFTADQLDIIKEVIANTAKYDASVRPQAILNMLTLA